jgi:N-acetylmuramoyl-L-alanine amidase
MPAFQGPAPGVPVDLGAPTLTTDQGPLFALRPIVARLGGDLQDQTASTSLTLAGTTVVAGPDNPVMLVGQDIVRLSQAPQQGEPQVQGLLVPVDFLRQSYGALLDYRFEWSPAAPTLVALRRQPRSLPVGVDVVHLQGVTTVVLQFPARFDYQLEDRAEDVVVRPTRDRFETPASPPRVHDPLVRGVRVGPSEIWLDLAAGASAESYTLEKPFRLVFDVVRREPQEAAAEEAQPHEPPKPQPGIHTIVIDPGHGGAETGAVGPGGELEKDLTLELARALRTRLLQRLPVNVVLTRDEDVELPLDTRAAIANQNKADLFVSIHLNSSLGSGAHGAETYFLSMEASDERAADTAASENSVEGRASDDDDPLHDLQLILWDLAQSYHLAESQRLAALIQEELNTTLGLRDRGVKQAPFRVLMGAAMPAVLVELGFLSNPDEEARLEDPAYRSKLVGALVRAISRYRAEVDQRARKGGAPGAPGVQPAGSIP